MDEIIIQILPSSIPLGRSKEASLIVSYTGRQSLENLRGLLSVPTSLRLLGLDSIHIPRVPADEQVSIPIQIMGEQPGPVKIHLFRLNARTAAGAVLKFADRDLKIEVSNSHDLNPTDLSLMLEPTGMLIQHQISRVTCRLHNNGNAPIRALEITTMAQGSEIYRGKERATAQSLAPGASLEMDVQILPHVAGALDFSIEAQFLIQEKSFHQRRVYALDVLPSHQQLAGLAPAPDTKAILVVTSAPQDYAVLRTDKEMNNILFELKHSAPKRERFRVEVLPAATLDGLRREIVYLHPYMIHFAGHGEQSGILLEDELGMAQVLQTDVLLALLKPLSDRVECVILNACETLESASQIAQCIPYVIGMRQAIHDPAAIAFSKGFYEAVGAGHPIETSFALGKTRLIREHSTDHQNPILFKHGREL